MTFRKRALTRAGAVFAGLLVASAIAAPAYAEDADTDLTVQISGTTIAADATGKLGEIDLKNLGETTPASVDVIFDITELKAGVVEFSEESCGAPVDGKVACSVIPEFIPAPGGTTDLGFLLTRAEGASGEAGELTVTIEVEGDDDETNDTATAAVNVGVSGVDLSVVVEDIKFSVNDAGDVVDTLVKPGGTTYVVGFVLNQGDQTAQGLRVSVTLPEHATFAEVEEGCDYTEDNRTVTCDYVTVDGKDVLLIPADKDTEDHEKSGFGFFFPVKIDPNIAAPVTLKDGTASVFALGAVPFAEEQAEQPPVTSALPSDVESEVIEELKDVDETDNTDSYAIFVGAETEGGTGGGDGSLPVTGVQAGVIGGVGLAVLVVGGVLFMLARRRRVVLVTPNDEKPTA